MNVNEWKDWDQLNWMVHEYKAIQSAATPTQSLCKDNKKTLQQKL